MTRNITAGVLLAGILAIVVLIGSASLFTVHETQQALVLQFGDPRRAVTEPGLQVKLPFLQQVRYIDGRLLHFSAREEEIIAADKKRLIVDAFARFRIADPLLFYKTVRTEEIAARRLDPIVSSAMREVLASASLQAILSPARAELTQVITRQVAAEAVALGLEVVDVRLTRTILPESNSEAIYKRMRSERELEAREVRARGAEEAQRIQADADRQVAVLLAQAQKQGNILRGEGDGKRFHVYAQAASADPEFFAFYNSLKAYRGALGDDGTTMVLSPGDSDFFRYFGDGSAPEAGISGPLQ